MIEIVRMILMIICVVIIAATPLYLVIRIILMNKKDLKSGNPLFDEMIEKKNENETDEVFIESRIQNLTQKYEEYEKRGEIKLTDLYRKKAFLEGRNALRNDTLNYVCSAAVSLLMGMMVSSEIAGGEPGFALFAIILYLAIMITFILLKSALRGKRFIFDDMLKKTELRFIESIISEKESALLSKPSEEKN